MRRNAERLVEYVKRNPDLAVNNKGELEVSGQLIKGSHIEDLVNSTLRKRMAEEIFLV